MWSKYYGKEYPHIGWWSKPESLDLNVFDIKLYDTVVNVINKNKNDNTFLLLLTNRLYKLENSVKEVLNKNNIVFDILIKEKD